MCLRELKLQRILITVKNIWYTASLALYIFQNMKNMKLQNHIHYCVFSGLLFDVYMTEKISTTDGMPLVKKETFIVIE